MTAPIRKYPRTPHLEGSRIQPGDEDLDAVSFTEIRGQRVVIEEKVDGANAAISFSTDGKLLLQSRGHYLRGGPRERHFALFKTWANSIADQLWPVVGHRYVIYGEWVYAKHTVFYDKLPHYFLVFDALDTVRDAFLDTPSRTVLLHGLPFSSVPILANRAFQAPESLSALIARSSFIGHDHLGRLQKLCVQDGLDPARIIAETDPGNLMEGLYVKLEADGIVQARYKFVRASFLQAVAQSGSHWLERPIVPNQLAPGISIW
jgi:RNA ligase